MKYVNPFMYIFTEADIPSLLVYESNGNPVKKGDLIIDSRGNEYSVLSWQKPRTPTKSGYVTAKDKNGNQYTYYAGCFGCKFIKAN